MNQVKEFHTLQEKVTDMIRESIFNQVYKPGRD